MSCKQDAAGLVETCLRSTSYFVGTNDKNDIYISVGFYYTDINKTFILETYPYIMDISAICSLQLILMFNLMLILISKQIKIR